MITSSWLSGSWRSFLYSSSVHSCHLFLISSASVRSIPFLSFIESIFAWNVPSVYLIFLKRSLVFPFYCFPLFLCTDHWGRLSYLSLLFFGTRHHFSVWQKPLQYCKVISLQLIKINEKKIKWVYLSFYPLLFASLLFTAICKAFSDSHFAFLHFFSMGMVLIPVSCTVSWTYVHSSSGTLFIRYSPLNLSLTSTV